MRAALVVAAITAVVMFGAFVQAQDAKKPASKPAKKKAIDPYAEVLAPIRDADGLPRVLLIGDSISMDYTLGVRKLLAGKANVHRIPTNGGPTSNGLAHLDEWLGKGKWDAIHFNWGLHDLKYMGANSENLADPNAPTSRQQIPPAQYEKNLRELVGRLQKTGAKLIWAATTPVPAGSQGRVRGDAAKYNAIALKIMTDSGVAIDDLYALALPRLSELQQPKNVHFTAKGYQVLARQVADCILEALGKPKLEASKEQGKE
jgi:acyl-CoA thioesterase-1